MFRSEATKVGYEKRIKMSREERAKQFLPFSAVRGLEEALEMKWQDQERRNMFTRTTKI